MHKPACSLASFAGLTFGGLLNAVLIGGAATTRLEQQGISAYRFGGVAPGETIAFLALIYLFGCVFLLFGVLLLALSTLVERRIYGAWRVWRWRPTLVVQCLTFTLLGALVPVGPNHWLITAAYRSEAAEGDRFATATIAIGLPAMNDFTGRYALALAALVLGSALIGLTMRVSRRRTTRQSAS